MASILQVSIGTVNLRQQAKSNIKRYIDERLPEEYEKCLVGLTAILREAWNTSQQAEDRREKIQALSLAKECYSMKLDLLTNATVVDDAIRFVAENEKIKKSKTGPSCVDTDTEEEEEEEEEETTPTNTTTITTNQVF